MCTGHWRNRLQYVRSGFATTAAPARASRRSRPFRSVVTSPALRIFRTFRPEYRFQSAQADLFCLTGAFGFRATPVLSDEVSEFQPIQIAVAHRVIVAPGQGTTL
jgi:hypothetical protein